MTLLPLLLLFPLVAMGPAWPLVARRRSLDPAERLLAAGGLSLVGLFLLVWLTFVAHLPAILIWVAPFLAVAGLASRRHEFAGALRDPAARELVIGQLLVTAACLAWLGWIRTFSGGAWTGDWMEHWLRSRYLLEQGPLEARFIGSTFTARPPLANGLTAAFLALTRVEFPFHALASTLLASLAFAPAALLAGRLGGRRAVAGTAVLFMLNPMFLQNATHPWTKLPAAAFVLGSIHFFLRARDATAPLAPATLAGVFLAAGILAHYSAGPYAVVLAAAWLFLGWRRRGQPAWRAATWAAGAAGGILLAGWFVWSVARLGPASTFLSNTSVQSALPSFADQAGRMLLNARDTLVPHFLRTADPELIAQTKPWGQWRDAWFMACQLNLPLMLGSTAWLVLALMLRAAGRRTDKDTRLGWTLAVTTVVALGIAVVGERDVWGSAHLCLQPLVLGALAFLAAGLPTLPGTQRLVLLAGATLDAGLGIVLHFGIQNLAPDRWLTPGAGWPETALGYNRVAVFNAAIKQQVGLIFPGDLVAPAWPLLAAAPAVLLALAVWRWRRAGAAA